MKFLPLVLAVPLVLAGCLTSSQPPEAVDPGAIPPGALPALPAALAFEGCTEQAGIFPVPAGEFADLPEGFTAPTFDPAGAFAMVFGTTFHCASPTAATEDGSVAETLVMLVVEPPEELRLEGEVVYGLLLSAYTTSEAHAAAYRAAGLSEDNATEIAVEVLADTPAARAGHALTQSPEGTLHYYNAVEGPEETFPAGQARIFKAEEGKVVAIVDVAWTESPGRGNGEGVVRFDPPGVPPVFPGLAFHAYGEGYGWTHTFVPVPEAGAEAPAAGAYDALAWVRARFGGLPALPVESAPVDLALLR